MNNKLTWLCVITSGLSVAEALLDWYLDKPPSHISLITTSLGALCGWFCVLAMENE
jgi:hypothetical protein